ncbi:unnamed protein product [Spirodela intermedia]|uniref:Uncharacterized protein n=1 Tax=Spirodela intermedia TaxID=51605 RepID=A0A7I8J8A9_SPIIN|nr:unnamed protein product [Spirodela intermedia]CAA6666291.1 unnamed protein product [Spirodela intermedia]
MDPEGKKFGRGAKELTGGVDLLNHYQLLGYYDFFCKRALPLSISETSYLRRVVGDTEIRKGEGMELGQLLEETSRLDNLREAFDLRETAPVELPSEERGRPTISGRVKIEAKERERKPRKHKEKDREKDKDRKKHKHRHKGGRSRENDKDQAKEKRDKSGHSDYGGSQSKRHEDKKRKHDGTEDISNLYKHKKSKHKNSKVGEMGAIRVVG